MVRVLVLAGGGGSCGGVRGAKGEVVQLLMERIRVNVLRVHV
jgi:hypothetical protein